MILHVYQTRASTPKAPRWRARIQLESVRIWTYPRTRPEAAATKAIAMAQAALSYGEAGDFVGLADGSFRRMRVGEMVIDDE